MATISEELTPDFVTMTIGGIADYDGVDWSKVEPHNRHAYETATDRVSAYEYVVAVQRLERLSRREVARWGSDFDLLLTPTSGILPPPSGQILDRAARRPRSAGLRDDRLGLLHRLRQHHRPARRSRCRCTGTTRASRSARCSPAVPSKRRG